VKPATRFNFKLAICADWQFAIVRKSPIWPAVLVLRRREFIAGLGGAAAWPLAAKSQQRAMPVIGFLGFETPGVFSPRVAAFRQGLSEMGYVEGRNVTIAFQWAGGWPNLCFCSSAKL
jgi:hypothetical protein